MFRYPNFILNPAINHLIAQLGHFDEIVICDAGLPIPKDNNPQIIDLSLIPGIPEFIDVFQAVVEYMAVEKIVVASEMFNHSNDSNRIFNEMKEALQDYPEIKLEKINHENFKTQTKKAKAFIRTGETTPYANAILVAGVNF
ncbi:D-ribose pyranase [Candidatus Mycoplasma pogonae]